ncbi:unnamed protein product, partial [Schistosoma mattheei]
MGRKFLELNRPVTLNAPDIEAAHTDFIAATLPTIGEIRMAVRQIRSGKAAGPDSIPSETLMLDIEMLQTRPSFYSERFGRKDNCPGTAE